MFTSFYYQENIEHNLGTFSGGGPDGRTLRFSKVAGVDLRPLLEFWGALPVNEPTLKTAVVDTAGLQPSLQVRCLLERYKTIVPRDNAAFNTYYEKIYPSKPYKSSNNPLYGIGWFHTQSSTYSTADGTSGVARIDVLLQKYFPTAMQQQSCAGVATGEDEVEVPKTWSWMPTDGQILVGGDGVVTQAGGSTKGGGSPAPAPAPAPASAPAPAPALAPSRSGGSDATNGTTPSSGTMVIVKKWPLVVAGLILLTLVLFAGAGAAYWYFFVKKQRKRDQGPSSSSVDTTFKRPDTFATTNHSNVELPPGWEVHYDEGQHPYYYHEETAMTQWDPPVITSEQTSSAPKLPARRGKQVLEMVDHPSRT